ncbi:MAG: hypothetical protein ABIQ53_07005 [Terracoccus sp.]
MTQSTPAPSKSMTDGDHAESDVDRLAQAFFRAVSFEAGGRPSYDDIYDLFIESGLLIKNSGQEPEVSSISAFITPRQQLVDSGELTEFSEVEVSHRDESFGNIAHRLSIYTKRGVSGGVAFQGHGVISTQLIHTPTGWRMTSMAWDDERAGLSMPDDAQDRPAP